MPLDGPVRERLDPKAAVFARAIEFADVDAENDLEFYLAAERLLAASKRYARAEPDEPPRAVESDAA